EVRSVLTDNQQPVVGAVLIRLPELLFNVVEIPSAVSSDIEFVKLRESHPVLGPCRSPQASTKRCAQIDPVRAETESACEQTHFLEGSDLIVPDMYCRLEISGHILEQEPAVILCASPATVLVCHTENARRTDVCFGTHRQVNATRSEA